jgi:hypothetical protein
VIDQTLVAGDVLFATHRDRALYLGKSARDRAQWLKDNASGWRRIQDVQQEAAPLRPPVESETNLEAGPAEPNGQTSSHDVRKDGGEESDVTLGDAPAGGRSPPYQPTTLPVPVQAIIKGTTKAELLPPANAAMSETKEPKTETTPPGAVGPKRGRRRGRQPENQKLPAEVAKAGRMLSPERMRIVLNSLTEVPILNHAATKAGIHRKTLEYWLRRSAAGDAGYDIEWQGIEWRFHELCASAIDEGNDRLCAAICHSAMGVVSKTDENGNFILEACGQPNMKMARHFLQWRLPETYGERPKRHVPHNTGGVLVIGGDMTKKPEYGTNASVKARKWKSFSRKFEEAKT